MKANHNIDVIPKSNANTVFYGSKILKWKQITTGSLQLKNRMYCFLWFKDTKMKANHNHDGRDPGRFITVFYGSKILKWKQITTPTLSGNNFHGTVFYGSKILKWKQITTHLDKEGKPFNCFLWFKDTKMKANHNAIKDIRPKSQTVFYLSLIHISEQITTGEWPMMVVNSLFSMVQRY